MFERLSEMVYPTDGGTALKPEMREGWRTYNFEVEDLHTYIAGGIRVHNASTGSIIFARNDFEKYYGHDYDGNSQLDRDAMMTAAMDGKIRVYEDYRSTISTDSQGDGFSQIAYDHLADKIERGTAVLNAYDSVMMEIDGQNVRWSEKRDNGRIITVTESGTGILLQQDTIYAGGGGERNFFEDGHREQTFFDRSDKSTGAIIYGANSAVEEATLGSQRAAAAEVGEIFGALLGKSLGNGNALAEIGLGTVLGLALSKLGSALAAGFQGDMSQFADNFIKDAIGEQAQKNGGLQGDIIDRMAGVGSSLLVAELADALGLSGFEGQLFTTAINGVASSVSSQLVRNAVSMAQAATFDIGNLFGSVSLNATQLAKGIGNAFGGVFGSALGSMIVTPESPQAAVFASVGSAIGATIGTASIPISFVGSFVGSFIGQMLGGLIGNALEDNDDLAEVYLGVTKYGTLGRTGERAVDHGDLKFARTLSDGVIGTVNELLKQTGLHLDDEKRFSVEIGYFNNYREWLIVYTAGRQEFYDSKNVEPDDNAAALIAQTAIERVIDRMTPIGGDILMRRAFYASRSQSADGENLVSLGFDLQVAKDYKFYLDHKGAINALIAAEPTSAFAAGWLVTMARVNELGLNHGSANDFKSGFYANLKDIAEVQGPHSFGQALPPERLGWIPDLEASDIAAKSMETGNLILRSSDGLSAVTVEDVFGPGRVRTVVGADNTDTDQRGLNDTHASVILIKAGNGSGTTRGPSEAGAIIVGGNGYQDIVGGSGNDWIRGGDWNHWLFGEGGDDLLVAGKGGQLLEGGTGRNTYYLQDSDATVKIATLDAGGSDTIMAPLIGARAHSNYINISALAYGPNEEGINQTYGVNSAASDFTRSGADLIVSAKAGYYYNRITGGDEYGNTYYETTFAQYAGTGTIKIKNFFLSDSAIDHVQFSDATLSNAELWARAGVNVRVNEIWNNSDRTNAILHLDTNNDDPGSWDSRLITENGKEEKLFDLKINDDGGMITTALDLIKDHDWERWYTSYARSGGINLESVTLDDGTSIRSTTGIIAGDVGDDILQARAAGGDVIGDRGNDTLTGSNNSDSLYGNSGNDRMIGNDGRDFLYGGTGNDTYVIENAYDEVIEKIDEGSDLIEASVTYTLGGIQVENITLTGSANIDATGNSMANEIVGNEGNNILIGGDGNDTLNGGGGEDLLNAGDGNDTLAGGGGADILKGGDGSDTYLFTGNETIVEQSGEGVADTIQSTVSYSLGEINVERVTLLGSADLDATGNRFNNVLTGNEGNNRLDGGAGTDTLQGGLGNDTYIVDNVGDVVDETAGQGTDTIESELDVDLGGIQVERIVLRGTANVKAIGNSFDNALYGNDGANTLVGGAGNDTLNGGGGADAMRGGTGDDTYTVNDAGDVVTEESNEGTDLVRSSVSFSLGGKQLENLTLLGAAAINATGNSFANILIGNSGANVIAASGGNDTLDGGEGADTLKGGTGDDTYFVDNVADTVEELSGEGTDVVNTSVSFSLEGQYIERLSLIGIGNINGTGNGLGNTIDGTKGNNVLDGGAGADTLIGGLGDDTYIVDNAGDVVTEAANEGTDTVQASVTFRLRGSQAENLTLVGSAAIDGTGNDLDNILLGNEGANTLTGDAGDDRLDGGAGADTLIGGLGNDTYVVDNASDVIIEATNEGTDTVETGLTFSLGGLQVERLSLTGSADVTATGNTLDNTLLGNDGANTLVGKEGDDYLDGRGGADMMTGGVGNDTYTVNHTGDVVTENSNEGTDLVRSSIAFSLGGKQIENLTLLGSAAINATGNSFANVLIGNSGANVITASGGNDTLDGGDGADTLKGGAGDDTYFVDNAADTVQELSGEGADVVNASVSFSLEGQYIETLNLIGIGNINGTGNGFSNILVGTKGNNVLNGGNGGDTLQGGRGNDTIDGGDGFDTAIFTTRFADTLLFQDGTTTRFDGPEGVDTLTNIEQFVFADVKIGFQPDLYGRIENGIYAPDAEASAAGRLYFGLLDRPGESSGVLHHQNFLEGGGTINQLAQNFLDSTEYRSNYANLNNANFVNELYKNTFGRTADVEGLNNYTAALSNGTSRADVAVSITQSIEAKNHFAMVLQEGWVYM